MVVVVNENPLGITIGADPEVFVRGKKTKKFFSAHGMIKGDKKNPLKVPFGAVQVDGMALEFNIDPASTSQMFVNNVKNVLGTLSTFVPKGMELAIVPTAKFDPEYFAKCPPESKILGCDPDWDAYTEKFNPRPQGDRPVRTAAGHIHIGWTKGQNVDSPGHIKDCVELAKQMDYYVGYWSPLWDPDKERRQMYGKAGCFRVKPYGMEYRTPSNAWLKSDSLMEWVFNATLKAVYDLRRGHVLEQKYANRGLCNYAKHIINDDEYWAREDGPFYMGSLEKTGLPNPPRG